MFLKQKIHVFLTSTAYKIETANTQRSL